MPSLADVLKDASKYPDTTEWTLPDGTKTTVGEIRTEFRNTAVPKEDFTRAQQKAAEERRALEAQYANQVQMLQQQQLALQAKLSQGTGNPTAGNELDMYLTDSTWGPVARAAKAAQDRADQLARQMQETEQRLRDQEQAMWLSQHAQVLRRIQDRDEEMRDNNKVSELLNLAKQTGVANLDIAYQLYTRDRDIANAQKAAEQAAYDRAKAELGAPHVPTGANQGGMTVAPNLQVPTSLDDAERLAMADPEIAKLAAQPQ